MVSGDVFLPGFAFDAQQARTFAEGPLDARRWLVPNAPHYPRGDFGIGADGLALAQAEARYTWASVGLYRASLFAAVPVGTRMALRPLLDAGIAQQRIGATLWPGAWTDVGTAERLDALNGLNG